MNYAEGLHFSAFHFYRGAFVDKKLSGQDCFQDVSF